MQGRGYSSVGSAMAFAMQRLLNYWLGSIPGCGNGFDSFKPCQNHSADSLTEILLPLKYTRPHNKHRVHIERTQISRGWLDLETRTLTCTGYWRCSCGDSVFPREDILPSWGNKINPIQSNAIESNPIQRLRITKKKLQGRFDCVSSRNNGFHCLWCLHTSF